ncbi:MAG: DUF6489 family protein [Candidatus Sedimenticola sp. PURPLELP]
MKINIELDLTPEEFRKMMGWPDLSGLHEEMLTKFREQMEAGAEGYDPMSLLKPYMAQSASSMDGFQKMMQGMMEGYFSNREK